jgi:hypothetical protein
MAKGRPWFKKFRESRQIIVSLYQVDKCDTLGGGLSDQSPHAFMSLAKWNPLLDESLRNVNRHETRVRGGVLGHLIVKNK